MEYPISIVTSMYNRKEETVHIIEKLFFTSVLNNASSSKQLIIVDDSSPLEKQTKELINKYMPDIKKAFGDVKFERNEKNLGFAGSYNKGMKLADGKLTVVTNDDVYFPENSIVELANTLLEDDHYGIIAPIMDCVTWTDQHCKQAPRIKSYSEDEFEKLETFSQGLKKSLKGIRIKTNIVHGICFAVNTNQFNEIGGFDESFRYGTWEDNDLSRRYNQEYDIIINPEVFIHHGGLKGGKLSVSQQPYKLYAFSTINAIKYVIKWRDPIGTLKYLIKGQVLAKGNTLVSKLIEDRMKIENGDSL